jgi:hypothetical protein
MASILPTTTYGLLSVLTAYVLFYGNTASRVLWVARCVVVAALKKSWMRSTRWTAPPLAEGLPRCRFVRVPASPSCKGWVVVEHHTWTVVAPCPSSRCVASDASSVWTNQDDDGSNKSIIGAWIGDQDVFDRLWLMRGNSVEIDVHTMRRLLDDSYESSNAPFIVITQDDVVKEMELADNDAINLSTLTPVMWPTCTSTSVPPSDESMEDTVYQRRGGSDNVQTTEYDPLRLSRSLHESIDSVTSLEPRLLVNDTDTGSGVATHETDTGSGVATHEAGAGIHDTGGTTAMVEEQEDVMAGMSDDELLAMAVATTTGEQDDMMAAMPTKVEEAMLDEWGF